MKKIWKAKPKHSENILEQLLAVRDLRSAEDRESFLEPTYEKTFDPFLLADMDRAVARIKSAIEAGEKITIYADYDADAVTAAAVLLRFFKQIGYGRVDYYIPDRFSEGYGMNSEAIKILAERGTKLIITVDCGINAFEAVDLVNELGMDMIVTDHHQITSSPLSPLPLEGERARVRGDLPKAVAVINPHRPDDQYPFKDLTGVGVAFKLAQAMTMTPLTSPLMRGERGGSRGFEKWLLDLVAIGTVADCQSLLGENRIFVKWGLHVLKKTRWVGLQKLIATAGLAGQEFDTYKIGFMIAPRINAAGRIEHANLALELLLTDNADQAQTLADRLEKLNHHRQELTEQILSEAREQVLLARDKKILLAQGEAWPKGIVGLVAGKLTEEFYRPVLVLSQTGGEAIGSARSIARFNIVEAISQSREILVRFGGHAQAAGFTLLSEHIEIFHKQILEYAEKVLTEEDLFPVLYYDAEIGLFDIKASLIDTLQKFAPFGQGNPRPRFRIDNLAPRYIKKIGNGEKHLRMYVAPSPHPSHQGRGNTKEDSSPLMGEDKGGGVGFSCIGFNLGFWAEKLKLGDQIDIICEPQWNEWNGERNIQLKIIDLDFHNS